MFFLAAGLMAGSREDDGRAVAVSFAGNVPNAAAKAISGARKFFSDTGDVVTAVTVARAAADPIAVTKNIDAAIAPAIS